MNTIYSKEQIELSRKLLEARMNAGLTQAEVARKMNKSQSYVSKVESGQSTIDVIELKQFAKLFKKDISFFI